MLSVLTNDHLHPLGNTDHMSLKSNQDQSFILSFHKTAITLTTIFPQIKLKLCQFQPPPHPHPVYLKNLSFYEVYFLKTLLTSIKMLTIKEGIGSNI